MRNQFVAAIADEVFIVHAAFGSRTEQFCRDLLEWHKPLWTMDSPENIRLISLGAKILRLEGVRGKDEVDQTQESKSIPKSLHYPQRSRS